MLHGLLGGGFDWGRESILIETFNWSWLRPSIEVDWDCQLTRLRPSIEFDWDLQSNLIETSIDIDWGCESNLIETTLIEALNLTWLRPSIDVDWDLQLTLIETVNLTWLKTTYLKVTIETSDLLTSLFSVVSSDTTWSIRGGFDWGRESNWLRPSI